MNIVIGSAFRNMQSCLQRYFAQVNALKAFEGIRDEHHVRVIAVEGDSVDATRRGLNFEWGVPVQVVQHDHGKKYWGSVVDKERMRELSAVGNRIFANVLKDDDLLVYVESDLLWDPETMCSLITLAMTSGVDIVAPMVFSGDAFYDVWAFRKGGVAFTSFPPFHEQLIDGVTLVDSVGSCLVMQANVARRTPPMLDGALPQWCEHARKAGFTIGVASGLRIAHPDGNICNGIPAGPPSGDGGGPAASRGGNAMKVLWIGDAAAATGFARATHAACDALHARGHEVHVLGLNYFGDPHDYPYKLYPASRANRGREDAFGVARCAELVATLQPDVVVIVQDHWNMPLYFEALPDGVPVVGVFCLDGKNMNAATCGLNALRGAVFSTQFGADEARLGGYTGPSKVVGYGVDIDVFKPGDRAMARASAGFPPEAQDGFIVGTVCRNHPRKRLDLTIRYFAKWLDERDYDDAYLFIHAMGTGGQGYNLKQLATFYNVGGNQRRRVLLTPDVDIAAGFDEQQLVGMYQAMDVYVNTSQGEGWGLPVMEAMACGIPCIVPEWSALAEWAADAAWQVPCTTYAHTPGGVNVLGGVPDEEQYMQALDALYEAVEPGEELTAAGLALTSRDEYRWGNIGKRYAEVLEGWHGTATDS